MSLNTYVRALTPLIRAKSNKNLQSREREGGTEGDERGGEEGGKGKEAENHKFLRGSDKSCATFSEMNTLQIFPALILLARLQKTNLQPCLLHRAPATQRVRPVSFLSQILSRLTQCGEYNVSKEGASHSPSSPFHAGRRKMPRLSNPTPKSTPESISPIGVSSALLKYEAGGMACGSGRQPIAVRSLARPLGDHCCPRRILTRRKSIGARTND